MLVRGFTLSFTLLMCLYQCVFTIRNEFHDAFKEKQLTDISWRGVPKNKQSVRREFRARGYYFKVNRNFESYKLLERNSHHSGLQQNKKVTYFKNAELSLNNSMAHQSVDRYQPLSNKVNRESLESKTNSSRNSFPPLALGIYRGDVNILSYTTTTSHAEMEDIDKSIEKQEDFMSSGEKTDPADISLRNFESVIEGSLPRITDDEIQEVNYTSLYRGTNDYVPLESTEKKSKLSNFDKMSPRGYRTAAVALFFIGFFGVLNNMAVLLIIAMNKQLRTPLNMLLVNLAVSDLGISCVGSPMSLFASLSNGWNFSSDACISYAFLMSLFGIASITSLTMLAFERFLMIAQPCAPYEFNCSRAKMMIAFIWFYSFITTCPPLFGWGEFGVEGGGISCSVAWEKRSLNDSTFVVYLMVMGMFIPVTVMIFSFGSILTTVRKAARLPHAVARAECRVACMVIVMSITFLIAWTPYAILALVMSFGPDIHTQPSLNAIPAIIAKSSCMYNPIIYVGLNSQFRTAWSQLLPCLKEQLLTERQPGTVGLSITLSEDRQKMYTYSQKKNHFKMRSLEHCNKKRGTETSSHSFDMESKDSLGKKSSSRENNNGSTTINDHLQSRNYAASRFINSYDEQVISSNNVSRDTEAGTLRACSSLGELSSGSEIPSLNCEPEDVYQEYYSMKFHKSQRKKSRSRESSTSADKPLSSGQIVFLRTPVEEFQELDPRIDFTPLPHNKYIRQTYI